MGESGAEHLEEAVAAYRAALRERTPLELALTNESLDAALGVFWAAGAGGDIDRAEAIRSTIARRPSR